MQLADIGYSTYTRINALWLDPADCANFTKANCQEGLTLAHAKAWAHVADSTDDAALGYLVRALPPAALHACALSLLRQVLEDDVTFHSHFRKLWSRYASEVRVSGGAARPPDVADASAQLPADFTVAYVGQLSRGAQLEAGSTDKQI